MANDVKKIMGMKLVVPESLNELEVNSAIRYADEKYNEIVQTVTSTASSNEHRAIAVLKIVMELQAIKGNQVVFLDKSTKKVNDLIKKIDRLVLAD